jgi:hypothetical protein
MARFFADAIPGELGTLSLDAEVLDLGTAAVASSDVLAGAKPLLDSKGVARPGSADALAGPKPLLDSKAVAAAGANAAAAAGAVLDVQGAAAIGTVLGLRVVLDGSAVAVSGRDTVPSSGLYQMLGSAAASIQAVQLGGAARVQLEARSVVARGYWLEPGPEPAIFGSDRSASPTMATARAMNVVIAADKLAARAFGQPQRTTVTGNDS